MQNIVCLRLTICVHLFAVMVGPGIYSLYAHTSLCNILCRIPSAYRMLYIYIYTHIDIIYIYIYTHMYMHNYT